MHSLNSDLLDSTSRAQARRDLTGWLALLVLAMLVSFASPSHAAPGDIIFTENFERSNPGTVGNGWAVTPSNPANCTGTAGNTGCAGIDSDIPPFNNAANPRPNPTRAMFTRWNIVSVDSPTISLAGRPAVLFSFWLRRGGDAFSEYPEATGENYLVQYWDGTAWQILAQYPSGVMEGQIFTPVIQLPPAALHANFKLRFYQPSGSGQTGAGGAPGVVGYDYWHVDDIVLTEAPVSSYTGPFCDNFEAGLGRWSITAEGAPGAATIGDASLGTTDFQSTSHELDMRWGYVVASTLRTDMTGVSGNITYWLKSGTTAARDPDAGEELVVEYFNNAGNWIALATYLGSAAAGTIYNGTHVLPADAKHTGFRLRFRMLNGSGFDNDYWHVDDVCVGTTTPTADLALTMTRGGPLVPGANATYVLNVTNNGPGMLAGSLQIIDTLPAGLSYVSATGTGWTCSAVGQVVTCGWVGTLTNGAAAPALTLTVAVAAGASGTITNTATVTGTVVDNTSANNTATDSYTFPVSDLAMTKTRGGPLVPGSNATYALNVTNNGPATSTGALQVVDTLPAGLSYVSGTGSGWTCGAAGQVVTCSWTGTLVTGAAAPTLTLTVAVAAGTSGTITNTATVTGPGADTTPANNTATDSYTIPLSAYAYYKMDEAAWAGVAGEVKDASGNNRNANALGGISTLLTPASGGKGDTCRGANIPDDNAAATIQAVDTGIDINNLGNAGSISFWYRSRLAWNSGGGNNDDRTLLDATNAAGTGEFWLVLRQDGTMRFRLDNAGNNRQTVDASAYAFAANTWVHLAVTWSFTTGSMCIYVNGVADGSCLTGDNNITSTNNYDTLYIGDNRGGFTNSVNRGNSADGAIDELRLYAVAQTAAQIVADMNAAHSCTALDHYELSLATNSITCLPTTATVTACADNSSPCTNKLTAVSGQTALLAATGGTLAPSTVTFNATGVASSALSYPAAADGTAVTVTLSGETTAAINPRKCCPNGVSCVVANSCSTTFNTAGLIFSSSLNGGVATIPTQIAGTASGPFYVRAVKTVDNSSHTCGAAFSGLQSINFAYECVNPATCYASNLMSINGGTPTTIARNNSGSVSSYTSVNMTFDANGNAPFSFTYLDVGQVQLWASKLVNSATLTTSSNPFVVKPFGFQLSNIIRTSDSFANPAAPDATGAKFVKAGEAFSATVTAVTSTGSTAYSYGRETVPEGVKLTTALVPGLGLTNNPSLGGTFGTFSSGVATGTAFSWGEVGIITLTPSVFDGDYLGAGNATGTVSGNVGRFWPNHFVVTPGTLVNRRLLICAPTSSFTYEGEEMQVQGITLTAYNAATPPVRTDNYAGSFAKFNGSVIANFNFGAVDLADAFPPLTATALTTNLGLVSSTGSWTTGTGTINANVMLNRAASPDGPYESFRLGIAPFDSDDVTVRNADLNLDTTVPPDSNDRVLAGSTKVRFGRLWLGNAYGTEKRNLTLSYETQYWNGYAFINNLDDACTTLAAANFGLGNYQGALTTSITSVSNTPGNRFITLAAPNAAGSVDIVATLGNPLSMCPTTWTPVSPGTSYVAIYLRGNWGCSGTYDKDPVARATFGIFGDSTKKTGPIYLRENF